MKKKSGKRNLGDTWETSGRHLGDIGGDLADRSGQGKKDHGRAIFNFKIYMFFKRSLNILTLPGILEVGVTGYQFL